MWDLSLPFVIIEMKIPAEIVCGTLDEEFTQVDGEVSSVLG